VSTQGKKGCVTQNRLPEGGIIAGEESWGGAKQREEGIPDHGNPIKPKEKRSASNISRKRPVGGKIPMLGVRKQL